MKKIGISDITLKRNGRGFELTFREKLDLAKLLDRLGVSVIEVDSIRNPKIDSLLIKSIASAVQGAALAVPAGVDAQSAERTWQALREAKHPRMQVCVPVSPVQMEYIFHKKPDAVLAAAESMIAECRKYGCEVEFVAEDATRSDMQFLCRIVKAAITAGAQIITLCDTAGRMLPAEFGSFIDAIRENVPELAEVRIGADLSNDLALADACAVEAARHGVSEIKASAYCVDCASVRNLAHIFAARGQEMDAETCVHMTEIDRISAKIADVCGTQKKNTSPFDNGVRENGELSLSAHEDMNAVLKAAAQLGYDLDDADAEKVFAAFRRIAGRKDQVSMKELDAIIAAEAMQVPPAYQVESYVISTGNNITAMAHMCLKRDGRVLQGVSLGDGSIDAAFLAIEQILGRHYELDDFQIQAITEGREAMGQTVVKLRSNGKVYSGRGISTDIVGASIMAYLNALNKIVYEEEEA